MQHTPHITLAAIEGSFHEVIRGRVAQLSEPPTNLEFPKIDDTTPTTDADRAWFPIPGMYGGFAYWLDLSGAHPKLVTESWSRVCEGSGQRHEIDVAGSKLVAEGFV
jgi:hypothetical protein